MKLGFDKWMARILGTLNEHGSCMAIGDDIRPFPDFQEAYEEYAAAIGKLTTQLTKIEKQTAILNAVMDAYP